MSRPARSIVPMVSYWRGRMQSQALIVTSTCCSKCLSMPQSKYRWLVIGEARWTNISSDFDFYVIFQILLHLHAFHGYSLWISRLILSINICANLMIVNFMVASTFASWQTFWMSMWRDAIFLLQLVYVVAYLGRFEFDSATLLVFSWIVDKFFCPLATYRSFEHFPILTNCYCLESMFLVCIRLCYCSIHMATMVGCHTRYTIVLSHTQ